MPFQKGHSPWSKGRRLSKAHREKLSRVHRERPTRRGLASRFQLGHPNLNTGRTWFKPGENHPNYIDGRADHCHRTAEYRRWRRMVKKRGGYKCQWCGVSKGVEAHHIDSNAHNNRPENGITLCRACHSKVHYGNPERSPAKGDGVAGNAQRLEGEEPNQ